MDQDQYWVPKKENQQIILPKRPQRSSNIGNEIQQVQLITNHYKISCQGLSKIIYYYGIEIEPEIGQDARFLRQQILKNCHQLIAKELGSEFISRGMNIWTFNKLVQDPIQVQSTFQNINYQVRLKYKKLINMEETTLHQGTSNPFSQIYNSFIKSIMKKLHYEEIGRTSKFFNMNEKCNQVDNQRNQQTLNIWLGFKTSVRLCQKEAYLMIDTSSRILRQETALDFMNNYKSDEEAKHYMIGLSVIAFYGNYRTYRIDDIDLNLTPQSIFALENGEQITYLQYYQNKYKLKIKELKQPLIFHEDQKTKKKIYLIPELVNMTGLTDDMRKDNQFMRNIAEYTKLNPFTRMNKINNHAMKLKQEATQYNIVIQNDDDLQQERNDFPTCAGQVLQAPQLKLKSSEIKPRNGSFQIRDQEVFQTGQLNNWVLIYASRGQQDDYQADIFVDTLQKCCVSFGIKVIDPGFVQVNSIQFNKWKEFLEEDFKQNGIPQIVVSLIPNQFKQDLYPKLKQYLFKEKGIPHQNVIVQTLQKNAMSICSKILLQMNAKIGYKLWITPKPSALQKHENIMIIGIDLFQKKIQNKKSCIGFVASIDKDFCKFYSKTIIKQGGQELLESFSIYIEDACKKYFQINMQLPETIIIYRDGLSEIQGLQLIQLELQAIQQGFQRVNKDYKPKLAVMIINKKINQRFFQVNDGSFQNQSQQQQQQQTQHNQIGNPVSGTIVADQITSANFDFFLCAQNVNQGTCTPTHYICVYNDTDFNEEVFWQLTYYQCFNYYNWWGAVRVPSATQYAHKLSQLIGETYQSETHNNISETLYYL